jgi:hypothetical protein
VAEALAVERYAAGGPPLMAGIKFADPLLDKSS